MGNYAQEKGFDFDKHLTNEVKKSLDNDGKIDTKEAQFMSKIFDKYGRRNIKIKKQELIRLGKEFGLNYEKLVKIGPKLESLIRERANIVNEAGEQQRELMGETGQEIVNNKKKVENILDLSDLKNLFENYEGKIDGPKTLIRACKNKNINISAKKLQKLLGVKIDGDIGWDTYNAFKNKMGVIKNGKTRSVRENREIKGNNIVEVAKNYMRSLGKNPTKYNGKLRKDLTQILGLDPVKTAWCAAFTKLILIKSGKGNLAKKMNFTGLSALGINEKKGGHVGIYSGENKFISGNTSGGKIAEKNYNSLYYKSRFIGWVMPENIGNQSAVSNQLPIPKGAIVVNAYGSNWRSIKRQAEKRLKLT